MGQSKVVPEILDENLNITEELLLANYGKGTIPEEYQVELERQYKEWTREQKVAPRPKVTRQEVKDALVREYTFLSGMDVREYTLYKKWVEVNEDVDAINWKKLLEDEAFRSRYNNDKVFRESVQWYLSGFYSDSAKRFQGSLKEFFSVSPDDDFKPSELLQSYQTIEEARFFNWRPYGTGLDESYIEGIYETDENGKVVEEIQPELAIRVVPCTNNDLLAQYWNTERTFTHTMVNNSNIGRDLRFLVEDWHTGRILGLFALSSDYLDLTARDERIGWSREVKTKKRMINHTAVASTVLPTQPFGFNYLGGKLMALLAVSDVVEKAWNEQYDTPEQPSKLVGVTTTSLYGTFSQYNSLTYWKKLGQTTGSVKREPSKDTFEKVKEYLRLKHPREYWEWFIAKGPGGMPLKRDNKQRPLAFVLKELRVDKSLHESKDIRGIYFCHLYENYREYLRMEIAEDKLVRRKDFDNSVDALTELWKEKYALRRINKLMHEHRQDYEDLFYIDMLGLSWEDARAKHLAKVGS